MDKTRIDILGEVSSNPNSSRRGLSMPVGVILEAMKIAMKQAYIAGQNSIKMTDHSHVIDADEYLKELEEQK